MMLVWYNCQYYFNHLRIIFCLAHFSAIDSYQNQIGNNTNKINYHFQLIGQAMRSVQQITTSGKKYFDYIIVLILYFRIKEIVNKTYLNKPFLFSLFTVDNVNGRISELQAIVNDLREVVVSGTGYF